MPTIELFDQNGNPIALADGDSIEFTLDSVPAEAQFTGMSAVAKGAIEVSLTFKDLTDAFDKVSRALRESVGTCPERCRCGLWKCTGDDPHPPQFGPFHVFPQHPCHDLADPRAALDAAAEELPGWEHEPNVVEDLVRRWGTEASQPQIQGSAGMVLTPKDVHDIATPISTLDYKVRYGAGTKAPLLPRVLRPPLV